jgi:hypothetical protein
VLQWIRAQNWMDVELHELATVRAHALIRREQAKGTLQVRTLLDCAQFL